MRASRGQTGETRTGAELRRRRIIAPCRQPTGGLPAQKEWSRLKWNIITDSGIDMYGLETPAADIRFATVPFVISVDEKDYVDDEDFDLAAVMDAMARSRTACHTACPGPGAWLDAFGDEGDVIAVTVSGALSGSYNSARVARDMLREQAPERRCAVIDSLSTGPEMCLIVRRLQELIRAGEDFDSVVEGARKYMESTRIIFSISSYNNLIRSGRMPRIVGLAAHTLNLWCVGIGNPAGEIALRRMARGSKRAVETIIRDMQERCDGIRKVVIHHCLNPEFAGRIRSAVLAEWPDAEVTLRSTRGLCGFYAEKEGVIVGYEGDIPGDQPASHLSHLTGLIHSAAGKLRSRGIPDKGNSDPAE